MMNLKTIIGAFVVGMLLILCAHSDNRLTVNASQEVVTSGYIGNGVEWDPYDEAKSWRASVSDEDQQKLFKHLDFMRMGYVRCMINSPFRYYDPQAGRYDKTRNIASFSRLLQYCTDHNIVVMCGEYNLPTWAMKDEQCWADMSIDYLNYLVNDLGFSRVKYFVIFNEPDGNWASADGDYDPWKSMLLRFADKMKKYPGLDGKVEFAGPDAVVDYKNPSSSLDAAGWVKQAATDLDSYIGIYDTHAYPGQHEVRPGQYTETLACHKELIPAGKKIVLGETGYKYWREADPLLMKEYNRHVEGHPSTKGTDSNMLVCDYSYGLDTPLLCMEVVNGGYSRIVAWVLDDAMHGSGDSGKTEDIKLRGMWNILGEEVSDDPPQEEIRPWYYTWSLMCHYFPTGSNILKTTPDRTKGVYAAIGEYQGKYVFAAVNIGDEGRSLDISLPAALESVSLYAYEEENRQTNNEGYPVPVQTELTVNGIYQTILKTQNFILSTNID